MKILSDFIEDSTIDKIFDLKDRKYVVDAIAYPNANIGADGQLRGVLVNVEGGVLSSLISNDYNSYFFIEKFRLSEDISKPLILMILPQYLGRNVKLVELGRSGDGSYWLIRKYVGDRLFKRTDKLIYHKTKEFMWWDRQMNQLEPIADKIFSTVTSIETKVIPLITLVKKKRGVIEHRIRIGKGNGVVLGNGAVSLVETRGDGYHPITCGKYLNFPTSKEFLHIQARLGEYRGAINNSVVNETPSNHRNPLMLLNGLEMIGRGNIVRTLVSVRE